ncbi:hypothetical protein HU200_034292 [Digitaria exilis]|uniref:Uncharacterized protein n=1 Tax=Digitaria exilis TaxID=1010633 RepID=A0A835BGY0_9POAL|nr:hypothetical protein HU200_034292 [Digitaria exilis]
MWNDFFVTYTPHVSQRSEEWMTERVNRLREEVRQMFEAMTMSAADTLKLVDTLERLGIDDYFREKIDVALARAHSDEDLDHSSSSDIHIVSLRFRLLRQHGLWVSPDVFGKFTDATGGFSTSLVSDPRGLLSLYNAAHLAAPGEDALDEAIAFSRGHLEAMKGELGSPLAEQVSRALEIPLPRFPKRLETMRYVAEYEEEEGHRGVLLELARLDFNLLRSLHLKELKDLTLWWKHTYSTVKLRYARDRLVENYFWTCGVFHEAKYSRARMMFAKTAGLLSMMDDTYDVHATLEECCKLNEAIQRWDESAVAILPEYLHMFYIRLLTSFKEFEDCLGQDVKFRMAYTTKVVKSLSNYFLDEAKWSREKYAPSFDEHLQVSAMSSLFPAMAVVLLLGAGDDVATKEVFEWAIGVPDVVSAGAEITRYLNDIASYKLGKNQEDVASSVECYAREHGVTVEDAAAAIAGMAERAWRRINEWCMGDVPVAVLPAAELVVNLARTMEVMYLGGRDAYTFGADLKGLIAALFLEPVPI